MQGLDLRKAGLIAQRHLYDFAFGRRVERGI